MPSPKAQCLSKKWYLLKNSNNRRKKSIQIQLSDINQNIHQISDFKDLTILQQKIRLQISTIQTFNWNVRKFTYLLIVWDNFTRGIYLRRKIDAFSKYFSHIKFNFLLEQINIYQDIQQKINIESYLYKKFKLFIQNKKILQRKMQQQINSYTFQLSQNLQKSVLQCHSSQPLFYMGARQKQKNNSASSAQKSFIYRLHFDQQNPRKSDLKKQQVSGYINGIYSYSKDSQDLLIITSDKNHKYQLSKTVYPLLQDQKIKLQSIIQSQSKISVVSHKQSKKHFLVSEKTIFLLNQDNFTKGQQLVNVGEGRVITSSIVDPIHELLTYVLDERQIIVSDKSLKKQKYAIKLSSSDLSGICSIDYNPNKQYCLLSCHLECIKFWDIRKPSLPIKVYTDHHSLLLNSKYNPSHDELISCSYDDGTVGLLRMNSVSSVPGDGQDCMVKLYDQHQDSVYRVGWAGCSPWLFTSIGYQAASVVVNYVPSVEKYRILL